MPPPAGRPVIDAAALLPAGAHGPAPPVPQPHKDTLGRGSALLEVVGMGHQGACVLSNLHHSWGVTGASGVRPRRVAGRE